MDALRKRLEEQQYNAMIANIKPKEKISPFSDEDYTSADAKMTKNQISAVINILFSMISVFVAIFIWMRHSPDYLVYHSFNDLMCREFCGVCFLLLL
jgi:Endoplasmic reticulum-based factor for assembly of V-ATPase